MAHEEPLLTDALCTRCGLCCDGSLFADVEIHRREADGLEILGLEIEDYGDAHPVLVQPCAALRGRRCTIYAHRPRTCRTFECRLLQDARRGTVSVANAQDFIAGAIELIARAEEMATRLGQPEGQLPLKERAAEALLLDGEADRADRRRTRAELAATMSELEELIGRRYIGAT